jgi:hypothetical protein
MIVTPSFPCPIFSVSRLGSAVRNVREGTGQFDTPLPHHQPLPPQTTMNGSADRCHLSSVTPLAFAHTKAVSIPCQLPYTRTPRTLAQHETATSARLLVLDPNTILASRPPAAPPGATRWALLLPISLSDSSHVVILSSVIHSLVPCQAAVRGAAGF